MSLFTGPEEHAANHPDTWQIVKRGDRNWALATKDGYVLDSFPTKAKATQALKHGAAASLYETERRWYAGESIPQWRPWADVLAAR